MESLLGIVQGLEETAAQALKAEKHLLVIGERLDDLQDNKAEKSAVPNKSELKRVVEEVTEEVQSTMQVLSSCPAYSVPLAPS
jgi:hypothetical protein